MGSIFDILGPVMVGPSSSHIAGAARVGYTARQLFGESVKKAEVYLHGSFALRGRAWDDRPCDYCRASWNETR